MSRVAALLLAAGGSRRMGRSKQLLQWRGVSLVRRAAQAALGSRCASLVVVVGADAQAVTAEVADLPACVVENAGWEEGIGSSLQVGVAALEEEVDAALVLLADQPGVDAPLLDRILGAWQPSGLGLAACSYGSVLGVPALFARCYFEALAGIEGDHGAKGLLAHHADDCVRIEAQQALRDIDLPADYDALLAGSGDRPDGPSTRA